MSNLRSLRKGKCPKCGAKLVIANPIQAVMVSNKYAYVIVECTK